MNTMNHFRMSYLTTPQELMDADLNDREKLFLNQSQGGNYMGQ